MRIQQAGATTAPVLVLLHGSGRASRMWDPALARLSADWHVLAPDLPGFGRSRAVQQHQYRRRCLPGLLDAHPHNHPFSPGTRRRGSRQLGPVPGAQVNG